MRINVIDNRALAAAVCNPAGDLWYAWSTGTWTTPFVAATHLQNLTPVESAPSNVDTLQTVDLGISVLTPGACAVVFTTNPLAILPTDQLSFPFPGPGTYGARFPY
jgi:hypothetical protein